MDLPIDKQAQVDALYLLITSRGYVPTELVVALLADIASPGVIAALASLDDHNERVEAERVANAPDRIS